MARPTKREQINRKISKAMSKMTPEMIDKLRYAFLRGASDAEAAIHAGIHQTTISKWRKKNPKLFMELDGLKKNPTWIARDTLVKNLNDPKYALEYLRHKERKEFSTRTESENENKNTHELKEVNINIKKKP